MNKQQNTQLRDVLLAVLGELQNEAIAIALNPKDYISLPWAIKCIDTAAIANRYASHVQPEPVNQQMLANIDFVPQTAPEAYLQHEYMALLALAKKAVNLAKCVENPDHIIAKAFAIERQIIAAAEKEQGHD